MVYNLPVPENPIARDILEMIAEVARTHPKTGWDNVPEIKWDDTDRPLRFQDRAMQMSGSGAGNLVACLEAVGLTHFDAVETFVRAKHSGSRDQTKSSKNAKGARHAVQDLVSPKPSGQPPTARSAAPGNVVHPERPVDAVRPPPRSGSDLCADRPAVVATGEREAGDPGMRRPLHRPEPKPGRKPKSVEPPPTQDSLF